MYSIMVFTWVATHRSSKLDLREPQVVRGGARDGDLLGHTPPCSRHKAA